MSLATLKAKYMKSQNVSKGGFSLNGGHRNLSYVGKTHVQHHCNNNSNDSNVVKSSTKNTKGMIATSYNCIFEDPHFTQIDGNKSSSERTKELNEKCYLSDLCKGNQGGPSKGSRGKD